MLPETAEVRNTLKDVQKVVGGYIEVVWLSETAALVCNEEGKLRGLRANRWILSRNRGVGDCIRGTFLIVGVNGEDFDSLDEAQSGFYMDLFKDKIVHL